MKRDKISDLVLWKNNPLRKPLIIRGARQVGKTWLMKEFGKLHYSQTVYLNFEENTFLKTLFDLNFDTSRIIEAISIFSGLQIDAENTLLIFDEIQEVPKAITSLKYFNENAPQFHVIAAGSMLGVAMHNTTSFPVGKVSFMDLYPLDFYEFLMALNEEALLNLIQRNDLEMLSVFKDKIFKHLKSYYYIGGMPEVVSSFVSNGNFNEVRSIQKRILTAYEFDFSKHAPNEIVPRIRMLWNSILAQLSKENRKFIYGIIKEGARAKDYELALHWLVDCGLIHKITRVSKPSLPLNAYEDFGSFKLYFVDIGLLSAMGNLDTKTLLEGNKIFTEFKGALTEQYVFQQLNTSVIEKAYYWSAEKSTAEIDFLIQYNGKVIPIEVKSEENLQAKSLKIFVSKFNNPIAIRISGANFRKQDWLTNIPLYAAREIGKFIEKD